MVHLARILCRQPLVLLLASFVALGLGAPPLAQADAGRLDPSFNTDGRVVVAFSQGPPTADIAGDLVVQPDGKIVAVGYTNDASGNADMAIVRLMPDGSHDPGFGGGGLQTVRLDLVAGGFDFATSVDLQSDGRIVVGGYAAVGGPGNNHDFVAIRLNTDGSRDTTFGTQGIARVAFDLADTFFDSVERVLVQSDDKIVLAGTIRAAVNSSDFGVARLLANGALDLTFDGDGRQVVSFDLGGDLDDDLWDATLAADDKIVLVGKATFGGTDWDWALARLLPDGALDATFGGGGKLTRPIDLTPGGQDIALGVDIDSQGRIVVAGSAAVPLGGSRDFVVLRFTNSGVLDSDFAAGRALIDISNGSDTVRGLVVGADDGVWVIGDTVAPSALPTNLDFVVVKLRANGSVDLCFGARGRAVVPFDLGGTLRDRAARVVLDAAQRPIGLGSASWSASDLDFAVFRLTAETPGGDCLFGDGFDSGNLSSWSAAVP
ncbi:MAG: hypothetical protein AAGN46_13850 [Acidobacteriota bacterium]